MLASQTQFVGLNQAPMPMGLPNLHVLKSHLTLASWLDGIFSFDESYDDAEWYDDLNATRGEPLDRRSKEKA